MKVKCEKIFVIGDSISCYYGEYLEPMLAGLLEYDRKGGTNKLVDLDDCTDGINGGDSSMVLAYLKSVVEMEFFQPDYLMLNCGIHDTKTSENGLQVPLVQYQSNLEAILEDFIEIGLDVIQMDQQENMGLELLGQKFGGRITFWNPVDIQTVMVNGTLDDIRAYCRKMVATLGRPNGGFIAKWYSDPAGAGHSPDAIDVMCEEFLKLSREHKK